jgi:hypothetical protein
VCACPARAHGAAAPARRVEAATGQRPLTSRVRYIQQLTVIMFCCLAPSLLHHSANTGHCSRTAEASCCVAACGSTGCHSIHGEARSTQKGTLCQGQHACARTSRRICTPTYTCLAFACTRMRGDTIRVARINPNRVRKRAQNQIRFATCGCAKNGC